MIFNETKMKALMKEAIKEGLDELVAKHVLATMEKQTAEKKTTEKNKRPLERLLHPEKP